MLADFACWLSFADLVGLLDGRLTDMARSGCLGRQAGRQAGKQAESLSERAGEPMQAICASHRPRPCSRRKAREAARARRGEVRPGRAGEASLIAQPCQSASQTDKLRQAGRQAYSLSSKAWSSSRSLVAAGHAVPAQGRHRAGSMPVGHTPRSFTTHQHSLVTYDSHARPGQARPASSCCSASMA